MSGMGLDRYPPEFIARAAPAVLGAREDDAPWTYDAFIEHVRKLGFDERLRLSAAFDRFIDDEKAKQGAAAAMERAEDERIRADPVAYAQRELDRAEARLCEFDRRLPTDDALAEQDELIAQLEQRRIAVKHGPEAWLTATRELEGARIERERLALLAADSRAGQASAIARVAEARAALEAAKVRASRLAHPPAAAEAAE